jgi:ANTAR domain
MIPPLPSPEPGSNGLRPDQVSGPSQVLTDSAPAPPAAAARPLVQMPTTAAPRDLAYTTALVTACQRLWAAPDVAALWRTVVDEAVALIAADGAAVVSHTECFWQTLAARPSDAAPGSAAAAVIEMLFRQGLLQQPISIDDLAEGASWDVVGRRALLVVRIEGTSRQPVRLVWYATRPATLSPSADLAEAFAHQASLAFRVVTERENLNRAVAARHRVGLAQGILMTRRQVTADQSFTLLQRRSQNTHVKLRTIAQTSSRPATCRLARRMRPNDRAPTTHPSRRCFVRWRHQSDIVANAHASPQR